MSTGRKGLSKITKPERVYATNEHTNRARRKERNDEKKTYNKLMEPKNGNRVLGFFFSALNLSL